MENEKEILENLPTNEENSEETNLESGITPALKDKEIVQEVQDSFLDYAMSVIVSRALPDVRDGLKPVHRRVIFGMYDAGYLPSKPHVKCAKVVGDVMGKYHPHGDTAIYGTIVRLAQYFSLRYMLVDGHGNFGNMDGDSAAAMRYTECRMSKLSLEMVRDINCNTIDFAPNYDGSLEEPTVLPSRFPNLLVNGSDGIAVGMATKMPPHNLNEAIDATIAYAKNPDISFDELFKIIKGPDFPTGGIIYGKGGIRNAYLTGRGTFKLRSKTEIVTDKHGKSKIVITEIPYQTNKASIVENIGKLAREKIIDGITSIKDFSKANVCIEIELRKDVVPQVVLNQLFKNTQLETSYGIINLCIVDGAPKVLTLKELIDEYLKFQIEVITRRTNFLKEKDEARIHIIKGLMLARDNIDEIVEMSKKSANPQSFIQNLMVRFEISEIQANAIASMTLSKLTGIESVRLQEELNALLENIKKYNYILECREHIVEVIIEEITAIKEKFGDERKTEISTIGLDIDDEDLIPEENIVIVLTQNGYIKRMSPDEFRLQNRGGRGVKGMSVYDNDEIEKMVYSKTHTDILFFTNLGKVYRKRGYEINEASRTGKGIPVINLLDLEKDERVVSIISSDEYTKDLYLTFVTKNGLVKRVSSDLFASIRQSGKIAISLKEGDDLLGVKITNGQELVCLANSNGKLVKFNELDVRDMGRTASGVKGMNIDEGEVIGCATSNEGKYVLVLTENGYGKMTDLENYRLTKRGSKGVATLNETEKNGKLVAMKIVNGDEDLLVITNNGTIIRTPLTQVSISGRNTQGVRIINLKENEIVSTSTVIPHQDEEENETKDETNVTNTETNEVSAEIETKEE